MRRRDILLGAPLLGGVLTNRSVLAEETLAVGCLFHGNPSDLFHLIRYHTLPLRRSLCQAGWCGAQEVKLIVRADESAEALAEAAADLARSDVKVIIAAGIAAARAAKQATARIPIVFYNATDPVAHGLVASLSRPEGNVTGFALMDETTPKLLEFIRQIKPEAKQVAYLFDPSGIPEDVRARKAAENASAAASLELRYRELPVRSLVEIEAAIPEAKAQGADALVVEGSTILLTNRFVVTRLIVQSALPAIYRDRQFAVAEGLISYGEDLLDLQRRAVVYVDRLLRGTRVSDLPVQQASTFELVVNLRTAKVLGLAIPPAILARADEIIE